MKTFPPKTYQSPVAHPVSLVSNGPLLQVEVRPAFSSDTYGNSVSDSATIVSLIDTGASRTSISLRLVEALNLYPVHTIKSIGAQGGWEDRFVYVVNFRPVGSDILFNNWQVVGLDLHGGSVEMLIGRDILSLAHFSYDGAQASFSITVPSLNHPMCEIPKDLSIQSLEKNPKEKKSSFKKRKDIQKESRKRNRNK